MNDIYVCSSTGCNSPASEPCALATPVFASLSFSALPASSYSTDASGQKSLTQTAVQVLQNAIETAVRASACATCTVKLQRAVDSATGVTLFSAPVSSRRLQTSSGLLVTFSTSGGSTAQLAAVSSATATSAFAAAVTTVVASSPGYSGVTATAVPVQGPSVGAAMLGLLGLLALALLFPVAYVVCIKKRPTKTAPGALIINAPPGTTVIIQEGREQTGTAV